MIYYTADTHFYDADMLKFERMNDPTLEPQFDTIEQRNEHIVKSWNETVTQKDDVYIVGDVSLADRGKTERTLARLNGRKHIIIGNHDAGYVKSLPHSARTGVVDVTTGIKKIRDGGRDVILCHYPLFAWERQHAGSFHVHGHLHATREDSIYQANGKSFASSVGMSEFRAMNAGTMLCGHKPLTLGELCLKNNVGGSWSDDGSSSVEMD